MTPDEPILLQDRRSDGVLVLTLNRPAQRNALATPLLEAVAAALSDADMDPEVGCVLIAGSKKVFAAGADLDELIRSDGSEPPEGARWQAWGAISRFSKPLVAAVEGWCLGAGSELMLRCDIVIAGRNARIGQPETSLGVIPGAGGTVLLPRVVGRAIAMDMVLTGEPLTGERAHAIGLVSRLVDDGSALHHAMEVATRLATRAPKAIRVAKASVKAASTLSLNEHLLAERRDFLSLLGGAEKAEGISAFREKREARWPIDCPVYG